MIGHRIVSYFALVPVFVLVSCASKTTSAENWKNYLKSQKRFYDYSVLPIGGFECTISIPTLEDSVRKAEELITSSGKFKVEAAYDSKLAYDKKSNSITIATPKILLEKPNATRSAKPATLDESTRAVYTAVNNSSSAVQTTILDLMTSMTMLNKDTLFIAESEVSENGSSFEIHDKKAKVSVKNTDSLRTENTRYKNGSETNSTIRYIEVKNGLLPVTKNSNSSSRSTKTLIENKYEFQNIEGWRLPQRILSNTSTFLSGIEVKTSVEIKFSDCKILAAAKVEPLNPQPAPQQKLPLLPPQPAAPES